MRIGIFAGALPGEVGDLAAVVARARDLERRGFAALWMANIFELDAITTLAVAARETERIELGTAVVPSQPRHPVALAQQALTAQAAAGGRFTLGIGVSHQVVTEAMLGLSFAKPARHTREYLSVLGPLLRGEPASFQGEQYRVNARVGLDVPRVPVLVAALGPAMLRATGELADGTITWMTGPRTLESHVGPRLREAAKAAGRPEPRIVAGFPVALSRDADAARARAAELYQVYGQLPSYRAMLDREGAAGPGDLALVGDAAQLEKELRRVAETGATDLYASVFPAEEGSVERTLDFLAAWS
jgi:F420-dependent oxidoreductase-like protein